MTDAAPLTSTNAALIIRAKAWKDAGHGVALAFVMETWGSSPRPVGSVMVIRDDMAVEGSVSGGCVEGAVIDAATTAIVAVTYGREAEHYAARPYPQSGPEPEAGARAY